MRKSFTAFFVALCASAQGPITPRPLSSRQAAAIRVDTSLVLIPVTVTDAFGAPALGMARGAFRLFEEGVEQEIRYFSAEDAPVSLGIVFDASRSMDRKLDLSRAAVKQVLKSAVSGDEYFMIEFSDAPRLTCPFTGDTEEIEHALERLAPRNWTALLDAVYMGTKQMKRARNPRRALLVVSDGADNYSRYSESEMKGVVREADVTIYSIALGGGLWNRHAALLRNLSDLTGGRTWVVNDLSELPETAGKIATAIRTQYVLGYRPKDAAHARRYRRVQVRLEKREGAPPLRASWRAGYYAE